MNDKINELYNKIDAKDKIINEQVLEIARLKELCNKYEEEHKTTFETWVKGQKVLTELEEYLNKEIDNYTGLTGNNIWATTQFGGRKEAYKNTLDKIQKLKEKHK